MSATVVHKVWTSLESYTGTIAYIEYREIALELLSSSTGVLAII